MNRYVVMVDAGYLLRQAVEVISKRQSDRRGDLRVVDPTALVGMLIGKAQEVLALSGKELLRVYWYDGVMPNGLTPQQKALIEVDDLQFRAGTVNSAKQQKGVDSLIMTDLIELTSHHAICDAVLVTGDSDLAVGIELAQKRGVRIAVLGVEDVAAGVVHHQSYEITSRADRVGRIGSAQLLNIVEYAPSPKPPMFPVVSPAARPAQQPPAAIPSKRAVGSSASPSIQVATTALNSDQRATIQAIVKNFVLKSGTTTAAIDRSTNRIDRTIDGAMLHEVFTVLGHGKLSDEERVHARDCFRATLA